MVLWMQFLKVSEERQLGMSGQEQVNPTQGVDLFFMGSGYPLINHAVSVLHFSQ